MRISRNPYVVLRLLVGKRQKCVGGNQVFEQHIINKVCKGGP